MTTELNLVEQQVLEGFKKKCFSCGEEKELSKYMISYSEKSKKPHYRNSCRDCVNKVYSEKRRLERLNDPEKKKKHLESCRKSYEKNKEKSLKRHKQWREDNKERLKEQRRQKYLKNREEILAKRKADPLYKEKIALYSKNSRKKPDYRKRKNETEKKLKRNNVNYRIRTAIAKNIGNVLKGKKLAKTLVLLGCSAEDFRKHLESQFTPEMNWDNYGSYWHVDHIIPCRVFNMDKEEHQKVCFNYRNCRPLEANKNLSKVAEDKKMDKIKDLKPIKDKIFGVTEQ